MKTIYNLIYCVLVLSLFSCTKTIDVSPTSVITTSSFWKTEDDAKGALNGMYVDLRSTSEAIFMTGDERSEIYEGGVYGGGTYTLYNNAMTADAPGHPDWYGYYKAINSANLILKYVPNITFKSDDQKNSILAQAYTMRAFIYFTMSKTWGDLVLRTDPTESASAEVTQKARSPKDEVFKLIKADIDKAIQLFPDNGFSGGRSVWSKAAANALKADVYLWTAKTMNGGQTDFKTALDACNAVQTADVTLLPNFSDIFKYGNKGNKEVIMAIRYNELEGGNYFWHLWIIGSAVPSNISAEAKSIILPVGGGQGLMVMTALVRNQFTKDDARKKGSFYEIYTFAQNGDSTFYTSVCLKGSGVVTGGNRVFCSDVILYRYADVLLMKAEAKNALGQDPSDEINQIRRRAYGPAFNSHIFVNGSNTQNDDAILKERLLELAYEGKRWWDLVRFNKAFSLVPTLHGRENDKYLLLFPIANSVLSLEPLIKQNPGY